MTYRADYLTASGFGSPFRLIRELEKAVPNIFSDGNERAGRFTYDRTIDFSKAGVTALVRFKTIHDPGEVVPFMIEVSGSTSAPVRDLLQRIEPDHQVARIDVCRDVIAPGEFNHYAEVMQDLADQAGIGYRRLFADPRDQTQGGTLYVGAIDSEARDVLYDKHAQDDTYPPGTLRFEHRLRPKHKARKRQVTHYDPAIIFRIGCIGLPLANLLDLEDHAPVTLPVPRERTAADSIDLMMRSYRRKFVQLGEELGSRDAVLSFLEERLPEALDATASPQRQRSEGRPAEHVGNPREARRGRPMGEPVQPGEPMRSAEVVGVAR